MGLIPSDTKNNYCANWGSDKTGLLWLVTPAYTTCLLLWACSPLFRSSLKFARKLIMPHRLLQSSNSGDVYLPKHFVHICLCTNMSIDWSHLWPRSQILFLFVLINGFMEKQYCCGLGCIQGYIVSFSFVEIWFSEMWASGPLGGASYWKSVSPVCPHSLHGPQWL